MKNLEKAIIALEKEQEIWIQAFIDSRILSGYEASNYGNIKKIESQQIIYGSIVEGI